ncbi:discoidin domain-containing protein [Flavitalea sp. BT771]|uniref:discoidin domain-containing protein n=1 Tax=Flavitalea sp. BT771 TaxID=3063329 RepID=UPI0026E2E53A|nr:discoidin domain-containing protein [Flavitalea sp. BT771]MDO6432753.1 discoidin domain-containing protein [Flavitalea sp. BT771]MDV6221971.1 discoidin domain-containing protein [Flavitalea sp. BT771]
MKKISIAGLWCFLLLQAITVYSQVDVLTQHNDLQRTGWNDHETRLNTKNVKAGPFAKLFSYTVDDQLYAQPLVVTGVNIPAIGVRDVVLAATVNNTVYAFDADSLRTNPYWQVNLTPSGSRPPKNSDMTGACGGNGNYRDFSNNMGIVGTPVISKTAQTIYLVTRSVTTDGTNVFSQYLHALDITTGAERAGSPVLIIAQVNGTGLGNVNGVVHFDPQKQNQRPGLLLLNGIVYIGYASHCDWQPYHGWLLGYDATTLQQKVVYNTTPDGIEAGIWMSGAAPAADQAGNIYLSTGNGTVGKGGNLSDPTNRGESLLKLVPSGTTLTVADFFTPYNWPDLEASDLDFGVTQVLLIPGTTRALTGCKDGRLYLADVNHLGGYNATANQILQTINLGPLAHLHSSFGYYKGATREWIYTWSENTALKAFPLDKTADTLSVVNVVNSGIQGPIGNSGALMAVSSNGSVDSTAILWVSHPNNCDANQSVCPGILRAVNANDVTQELWNSKINPTDDVGGFGKFVCPTVANGKVYLATFSGRLLVYGLTNNGVDTCNSPNIALNKTATATSGTPAAAFDGNTATAWTSSNTDNQSLTVDLGVTYNLCRLNIQWGAAYGRQYNILVSPDGVNWTTAQNVTSNSTLFNTMNLHASGRFVRMQGIARGTANGYSINEMEVYGTTPITCFPPSGLTAGSISANGASISWQAVGNATGYLMQYKTVNDASWTTVATTTNSVGLQALSCGTDYLYQVATTCTQGQQSAYSASSSFTTSACGGGCGPLPTRWTSSDIGAIGLAGNACYNGTTFSLSGSGADIGGSADAFRFAYITLATNEQLIVRIATQDNSNPANKAGIMMRESLTPDSRNAFMAITSGEGATFQYRNTTGGNTTSVFATTLATPVAPYWVKLARSGSQYSGYASPDGLNWTQVGTTVDLGFGANSSPVSAGLAITSHNNAVLSTATADNYLQVVPLPIQLVRFSGRSVDDQYIALQWATASEENNDHFEVERSEDGVHFTTALIRKAVGNSHTLQQYTAEDHEAGQGIHYYRLKEVDMDGRFTYSPVILVRLSRENAPLMFPNPANTFFTVVAGAEPIKDISLFDVSGRRLVNMLNRSGGSSLPISCGGLMAGVYVVQIRTGTQTYLRKLIKL